MDVDSAAWYPFAIKDGTTRMLIDSKNLPRECGTLAGEMVEIGSAMHAMEASASAINPGLSHHSAKKTPGGPVLTNYAAQLGFVCVARHHSQLCINCAHRQ